MFTDDGAPMGGETPEPLCFLEETPGFWFDWQVSPSATFTLPPTGTGKSWTIEYRARGRGVDLTWTKTGQGSATASTTQTLTPPTAVSNAAATTPLALTSRVLLKTTGGAVENIRQTRWLILDKRSGTMQYERWADHVWPTVTNAQGKVFTIADLDWNAATAIQMSAASGSADGASLAGDVTGDTGERFDSGEGIFFPEDLGDSALGSTEPPTDETGPIDIDAEEQAMIASATPAQVVVTFCVEVKVNYADVGNINPNPAGLGEDYLDTNSDKYARGHRIYAVGPASGGSMTTWANSGTTAGTPGCGTLVLNKNSRYDIWVQSDILVGTQQILVNRQPGNVAWQGRVLANYLAPTGNTIVNARTANPHQAWISSSVTSFGLYRREVPNISNAEVHTDVGCGNVPSAGACTSGDEVFLGINKFEKFAVAPEFGHAVAYVTDDSRNPDSDYGVVGATTCRSDSDNHLIASKEYASSAAVEGFANYYAAVVFNNTGEEDCAIEWNTQDFSGNGFADFPRAMMVFNCESHPYWETIPTWTETAHDHLGDPCDGVRENRGTEYDWMRLFWDLDTTEGLAFSTLLEVWDRANPNSWRETDSGTNDKPWERMLDAADNVGHYSLFLSQGGYQGTGRL